MPERAGDERAAEPPAPSPPLFEMSGDRFVPRALTRSPWATDALHGGPVAALMAGALDAVAGDRPFHPGRFTLELHRPVPLEPLAVTCEVARPGKRVRLLQARLTDTADTLLATATLQQIRVESEADAATEPSAAARTPPGPDGIPRVLFDWPVSHEAFHTHATEHRADRDVNELGPATQWIRVTSPLVEGRPLSALERAVAAADFANGVSKAVPMDQYTFINPDLTVVLHRRPRGEWICVDARTTIHGDGVGLARATLFDEEGEIGLAAQTLLIATR